MKRSAWRYLWKSEDIRNKLLITFLLLIIYRFAANIPVPGVDRAVVASWQIPAAQRAHYSICSTCFPAARYPTFRSWRWVFILILPPRSSYSFLPRSSLPLTGV